MAAQTAEYSVTYGISSKNRPTVIFRNYEYVKVRTNANGQIYWRCKMYQSFCKAHLVTAGDRIVNNADQEHNHNGNSATSLARKAVGEMKKKMTEISATPGAAAGSIACSLSNDVLMALPKRSTLNRTLQRHRQAVMTTDDDGVVLPPPPRDATFDIPPRFVNMVLYDSGVGPDRLIILGCDDLLDGLARSELWIADGTFKVLPSMFFQLYSIHFELQPGMNPGAIYCLLPNKQRAVYDRVMEQLKMLVPAANPRRILVDFESAAMSSFAAAYPNATVAGCYFHLTQSIVRKVQELGMKTDYESDDTLRVAVRCLSALSLVPEADVSDAYDILADNMPDHEKMNELLSYFERTYIRGRRRAGRGNNYGPAVFPINVWNHYQAAADGVARTTNSVEGWHYKLQSLFQCHHPTLWTFLDGLKKDQQMQKALFLQGVAGMEHRSLKKYRDIKERVSRTDILTFLRAIAHISHK
jgi:hypothetical protein